MARPSEAADTGTARADRASIEQPVERLRTGGNSRPIIMVVATVAVLATLIWQPWGRKMAPQVAARTPPQTEPAVAEGVTPSAATPVSVSPQPVRPSQPSPPAGPHAETYVSLVDNEWTVVALLAPSGPGSTEEPAIQHVPGSPWSPGDPLLVLQQGLNYTVGPFVSAGARDTTCESPDLTRLRTTVLLPAGRVVYLGVTFPGMDPRATVTAKVMQWTGVALKRQPPVVVPLSGRTEGQRYTVPSTGAGGVVLFAAAPIGILPFATYRFDVETPGISGHRYLYACIGT